MVYINVTGPSGNKTITGLFDSGSNKNILKLGVAKRWGIKVELKLQPFDSPFGRFEFEVGLARVKHSVIDRFGTKWSGVSTFVVGDFQGRFDILLSILWMC